MAGGRGCGYSCPHTAARGPSSSLSLGLVAPCPLWLHRHRRVKYGQCGEEGEPSDHPAEALSTLGTRVCLLRPLPRRAPSPTAENVRDSLQEDYGLIPCRSHPRLLNRVPGSRGEKGPWEPPDLTLPQPCGSARGFPGSRVAAWCPSCAPVLASAIFLI